VYEALVLGDCDGIERLGSTLSTRGAAGVHTLPLLSLNRFPTALLLLMLLLMQASHGGTSSCCCRGGAGRSCNAFYWLAGALTGLCTDVGEL
jgi:hypothetical protein